MKYYREQLNCNEQENKLINEKLLLSENVIKEQKKELDKKSVEIMELETKSAMNR